MLWNSTGISKDSTPTSVVLNERLKALGLNNAIVAGLAARTVDEQKVRDGREP